MPAKLDNANRERPVDIVETALLDDDDDHLVLRPVPNRKTNLDDHLGRVRELIRRSMEDMFDQVSKNLRELHAEAGAEAAQLSAELATLRAQARASPLVNGANKTGGTGDMPSSASTFPVLELPVNVPMPVGSAQTMEVDFSGSTKRGWQISENDECSSATGDSGEEDEEGDKHAFRNAFTKRVSIVGKTTTDATQKRTAVFADASAMKEKIREAVSKKEYKVSDFYRDDGYCQWIARSQIFDSVTLAVIAVNAMWIAVDTDTNDAALLFDAHPVFQIAEHSFCAFFVFEWVVRFGAFAYKSDGFKDGWFCFDTALVTMMVLETWVMTAFFYFANSSGGFGGSSVLKIVRLVRLTRMARMARLLRAVPELIILIKGIWVASRSVVFTLALLVIIMYLFAIVFRQIASEELMDLYFPSVLGSMSSLLMYGVLPDQAQIVLDCAEENYLYGIVVLIFILLASLTIMNMLVGVLCEVVSVVSSVEKEQLTVSYVKSRLMTMLGESGLDRDGDGRISRSEFESLLVKPEAAKIIQEIGVDVIGLVDFSDYIFKDTAALSFVDFMELLLQFRGTNNSTVKDIVDMRRFVQGELAAIKSSQDKIFKDLAVKLKRSSLLAMSSKRASVEGEKKPLFQRRSPGLASATIEAQGPRKAALAEAPVQRIEDSEVKQTLMFHQPRASPAQSINEVTPLGAGNAVVSMQLSALPLGSQGGVASPLVQNGNTSPVSRPGASIVDTGRPVGHGAAHQGGGFPNQSDAGMQRPGSASPMSRTSSPSRPRPASASRQRPCSAHSAYSNASIRTSSPPPTLPPFPSRMWQEEPRAANGAHGAHGEAWPQPAWASSSAPTGVPVPAAGDKVRVWFVDEEGAGRPVFHNYNKNPIGPGATSKEDFW